VVQTPVAVPASPTKIEMTAPVVQTPTQNGFLVQFMMPSAYTLATLPEPLDSKVKLREVAGKMVAAHQYSGSWSQSNYDEHLNILKDALAKAGVKTQGEPLYSRYNPPFTPWFLRKNEIWFNVQP
jgi:SOUL heme-binding protein